MTTKKIGRPTESLKDSMLRIRVDKALLDKLDELARINNSNRSTIIRNAIETVYDRRTK